MSIKSAGPACGFVISDALHSRINATDVEGRVTGHSFDIDVEIVSPFSNLKTGSHIMMIARGVYSFDGGYGKKRSEEMLAYLYSIGDHINRNRKMLKANLATFREQTAVLPEEKGWELEDQFFDENFPMMIGVSTRESVIDILDGRVQLQQS